MNAEQKANSVRRSAPSPSPAPSPAPKDSKAARAEKDQKRRKLQGPEEGLEYAQRASPENPALYLSYSDEMQVRQFTVR